MFYVYRSSNETYLHKVKSIREITMFTCLLYDSKITSGELTFAESGISRDSFTVLCTNADFVFPEEEIRRFCEKAKLTD